MDSDRKYRQHGYMDTDRDGRGPRDGSPKPQGPRPPIDVTGPRLPRSGTTCGGSRCYNCSTALAEGTDFTARARSATRRCTVAAVLALRAVHALSVFEADPGAHSGERRGQRVQPVHAARDGGARRTSNGSSAQASGPAGPPAPRNPEDARSAFDKLFKKI